MKKLIALSLIAVVSAITACAPAAGRPAIQMRGTTQDMVNAVVAACPTIAPADYNFLGIETIGDNFVSCAATPTTGTAIVGALGGTTIPNQKLTVSFSSVSADVVQVAISSFPTNRRIEDQVEDALRVQFTAVGQ